MKKLCVLFAIVLVSGMASAQVLGTGTYAFASFDNRGFDSVNLGNLNTRFNVPVVSRTGRGMGFNYSIQYEGLIWSPSSSNGTVTWMPDQAWGFFGLLNGTTFAGYVSYRTQSLACSRPQGYSGPVPPSTNSNHYVYHDAFGGTHLFNYSITGACPLGDGDDQVNGDGSTSDGSGYTYVNGYQVKSRNGMLITPATSATGQDSTSITDANGNTITSSAGSSFTDTLGVTALTVTGSSPRTFTYPIPSQNNSPASASATITYVAATVQTNFQCTGIGEYLSGGSVNLVSRITLADGTYYAFTYEPTPSVQGAVTGRLASITLPTGGTISYGYTGGCSSAGAGINADGTVGALIRTTTDGTRSYTRAPTTGGTSTTVQDEKNNQSVYNFVADSGGLGRFLETHRKVYQNSASGTPLLDRTTCYNGAANPNCDNQSLSLPVTEADLTESYNGISPTLSKNGYDASGSLLTSSAIYNGTTLLQSTTASYNLLGEMTATSSADGSGNTFAFSYLNYDESTPVATSGLPNHLAVTGTRGNLTSTHTSAGQHVSGCQHGLLRYRYSGLINGCWRLHDIVCVRFDTGSTDTNHVPDTIKQCGAFYLRSIRPAVDDAAFRDRDEHRSDADHAV